MVTFSTTMKPITMKGPSGSEIGHKAYKTNSPATEIECDAVRIVREFEGEFSDVSNVGAVPESLYMGRKPHQVVLNLVWNKSTAEMKEYAESLSNRLVPCINNVFMPGMKININEPIGSISGTWLVDDWSTSRVNSRGRKFEGILTVIEPGSES